MTTNKCQDSGSQVLRPVSNETAWCGCCGNTVAVVIWPGDENKIRFYAVHGS